MVVVAEQNLRDSLQDLSGLPFCGHEGQVFAVAISPHSRWLVTAGGIGSWVDVLRGEVRRWDLTADEPEKSARVLSGHQGDVGSVAIIHDSRWLVTGSEDKTARRWDLTTDEPEKHAG